MLVTTFSKSFGGVLENIVPTNLFCIYKKKLHISKQSKNIITNKLHYIIIVWVKRECGKNKSIKTKPCCMAE